MKGVGRVDSKDQKRFTMQTKRGVYSKIRGNDRSHEPGSSKPIAFTCWAATKKICSTENVNHRKEKKKTDEGRVYSILCWIGHFLFFRRPRSHSKELDHSFKRRNGFSRTHARRKRRRRQCEREGRWLKVGPRLRLPARAPLGGAWPWAWTLVPPLHLSRPSSSVSAATQESESISARIPVQHDLLQRRSRRVHYGAEAGVDLNTS